MATVARQPFAPLHSSRLHNLTSFKNRQNAISSPGKRKASHLDIDESENVDPLAFAKRSKGMSVDATAKDAINKATFALNTTSALKISTANSGSRIIASPAKKVASANRRSNPYAKPPVDKANTISSTISKPLAPSTAPAGRSPTSRTKRSGILSGKRRAYGRVDPPSFGQTTSAPFSLDAALKGTISGYSSRPPSKTSSSSAIANLLQPEAKSSWFFDIHEDTPEQEMTNLLQHSTCVLDISSDEETEERASRERDEGRNKENIPPADHVYQSSPRRTTKAVGADDMNVDEKRVALGEMDASEFFPEGCDKSSVILVPDDGEDDAATIVGDDLEADPDADFADAEAETEVEAEADDFEPHFLEDIDELMSRSKDKCSKATVLQPIEGTGESFELWESDSTKDESEAPVASL